MDESDALPFLYGVDKSKEVMAQPLAFPQYRFVYHFKSTTPYLHIHCPIFQHYHPLEADSFIFIHDKNIWKSRTLLIIVINMFKKEVKK